MTEYTFLEYIAFIGLVLAPLGAIVRLFGRIDYRRIDYRDELEEEYPPKTAKDLEEKK